MKHIKVISAVTLLPAQAKLLEAELGCIPSDQVTYVVDPNVIAGIKVTVDGHALDLTVKRQLAEIEQE